ncbi:peptide transporter PTR2A [Mycena metata]|uniref:Peptide transporter PTR2A n=1 Tax=Mycena metata TaxID=1033252 RepID=A0AAD7NR71_9AGAR|nr:peptide transporter PTR2A [Mycena metata]
MPPGFTSYKYEALNAGENEGSAVDGEEYEMDEGGNSARQLHELDGIHDGLVFPTDEERETLRRVPDTMPWNAYLIAVVELAERFSFYGAGVVFTNFIQHPLPAGSHTGAGLQNGQSGALGKGQHASTGITTFYQFWCSFTPYLGAYIADVYLGRFRTICLAVAIALAGHCILVVAALPGIIEHPDTSLSIFLLALIVMGLGTGLFKANISPLVAEQYKRTKLFVVTTTDGEQVIVDPALTVSRIYLYFYLMINLGSFCGQIAMAYTEKYFGFWLAFTLPTVAFLLCPIILIIGRKRYVRSPPTGSVLATFINFLRFASKGRWSLNPLRTWRNLAAPDFWESAKPSRIRPTARPAWMTFDDRWVDEVQRGLKACAVFVWFPIYWLTANQLNNNLTSQAATMTTNGLPNDVLSNIDPVTLVVFIPIFDFFVYPALQRRGIKFTALKRITAGFLTGSAAMVWAAVLQYNIYQVSMPNYFYIKLLHAIKSVQTNPCHYAAATCADADNGQQPRVSPINVWIQAPAYFLIAISEIFASITGFEYAFTKAPANMRSLVMSIFMGTTAFSAVLGEGFLCVSLLLASCHEHVISRIPLINYITDIAHPGLAADPLLVWNYAVMAVLAGVGGCLFWFSVRALDRQEDELNNLSTGRLGNAPDAEMDIDVDEGRRLEQVFE